MGFSQELIHPQLFPSQQCLVETGIPGIVNHSDALRRAMNAQFATLNAFKEPGAQLKLLNPLRLLAYLAQQKKDETYADMTPILHVVVDFGPTNPWDAEINNIIQMAYGTNPSSDTQEFDDKPHDSYPM